MVGDLAAGEGTQCDRAVVHAYTVSTRHPLADRDRLDLEDLADSVLIAISGPAPGYWRQAQAPTQTPAGALIHRGPEYRTLQEGLSLITADRGGMLLCHRSAEQNRRADIVNIPITNVPESALGLVWRRGEDTPSLQAFAAHLKEDRASEPQEFD